jgi:mannose-6-phosphate isomerase-like protein (cupin superfamily)
MENSGTMIVEPISGDFSVEGYKIIRVYRSWGYYKVLQEYPGVKVKELVVEPGKSLSMQRHKYRSEFWTVVEGTGMVELNDTKVMLKSQSTIFIRPLDWHKLWNTSDRQLRIVEIQYGSECDEADIERKP